MVLSLSKERIVGINEVHPDAQLHIPGGSPHIRLENSGTSAAAGDILGQIDFKHNDSDDAGVTAAIKCTAEDNAGNSYLTFHNGDGGNADERLRITSAGKVAIGNASPQQLLHVWPDTANTTSAYVRVTAGDRNSNTGIDIGHDASGNGQVNVVSNGTLTFSTNNTPRIKIANLSLIHI